MSWALPHAAIAGFYLFLSGLITGFFANQAAYDDIGARLAQHPGLNRLLGARRAARVLALASSEQKDAALSAMAETTDGFEIARRDLEIRGPGEFMGARQSGASLLRFADLQHDMHLLEEAKAVAPRWLQEHPASARAHIERWLDSRQEFLKA